MNPEKPVNRFAGPDSPDLPAGKIDETWERKQVERVRALRARRDPVRLRMAVDRISEQARSSANVMPAIVEAIESGATVGEIAGGLREVFGEFRFS
jgi:methylmalonyl-CoA mutase N-terminal domain/subunit